MAAPTIPMNEDELYRLLDERGIAYEVARHPAVFTVEEAEDVVPKLGVTTKNLFLCDKKKRHFYLVVLRDEVKADLRHLQEQLGSPRLSFAKPELLAEKLGLVPGSVCIFGILYPVAQDVTLVIDDALAHQHMGSHPTTNTATVFFDLDELLPLIHELHREVIFASVE